MRVIGTPGNEIAVNKLVNYQYKVKERIRLALHEVGQEHINYIRDLMSEKKTGRIYIIKGVEHQASAPGEAPAIRSGELQRSLFYNVPNHYYLEIGARTIRTAYAKYLELGTSFMDAREYLIRAARDKRRDTYNSLLIFSDKGRYRIT